MLKSIQVKAVVGDGERNWIESEFVIFSLGWWIGVQRYWSVASAMDAIVSKHT